MVFISVEERALHGTDQGVKRRCTSRPPESFKDLIECGYTSDKVRETLNAEGMLEEDNVVQTTQEDFQAQKKKGYVFEDYRPGQIVYHYTNLVIGPTLRLQTMPNKNSSKS